MSRRQWIAAIAGVALLAAAVEGSAADSVLRERRGRRSIGVEVGDSPPPFTARDLQGAPRTLADYRGRVVVLHFWASWCPHCRNEIPKLVRIHEQWGGEDVAILAVSTDTNHEALRRFLARTALPYPIVVDQDAPRSIADAYGIWGIPVTFLLAPDGSIAARFDGAADLVTAVNRLMAVERAE